MEGFTQFLPIYIFIYNYVIIIILILIIIIENPIPKMSLLLEAKSMPALLIKPRLILVTHTDDLGWDIMSNQQGLMFFQNLNRIVRKSNVTPGQILYCTTDCMYSS